MIGIYKITSPSKKVYIGQSINIKNRFIEYKKNNCKSQKILYNSFLKYGFKNHKFEILCECEILELNNKERYYQDIFECIGKNGLNCKLTSSNDKSGKLSNETKLKISISNKLKKNSPETRKKISIANKGKIISYETKLKMSKKATGRKHIEDTIEKIRISLMGNKRLLGNKLSEYQLQKLKESKNREKFVLDTQTGVFYESAKEVSDLYGFKQSTFRCKLNGNSKNNTKFIYA